MGGCYVSNEGGEEVGTAPQAVAGVDYGSMNPGDLELLESRVNFMPTAMTGRQQLEYTGSLQESSSDAGDEDAGVGAAMYQEWGEEDLAASGECWQGEGEECTLEEEPLGEMQGMGSELEGGQSYADMPVAPARQLLPAPAAAGVNPLEPMGVRVLQQLASGGGTAYSLNALKELEHADADCGAPAAGASSAATAGPMAALAEQARIETSWESLYTTGSDPSAATAPLAEVATEAAAAPLDIGIGCTLFAASLPSDNALDSTGAAAAGANLLLPESPLASDPIEPRASSVLSDGAPIVSPAEHISASSEKAAGVKHARADGSHIPRPGGLIASLREASPTRIPRLNPGAAAAMSGKLLQGVDQQQQQQHEELGAEPQLQQEAQLQQDEMQQQFSIDLEGLLAQQQLQQQQGEYGVEEADMGLAAKQQVQEAATRASSIPAAAAQKPKGAHVGQGGPETSAADGKQGADFKGGGAFTNTNKDPKEGGLLLTDSLTRAPAGSSEWSIAAYQDQEGDLGGSARVTQELAEDSTEVQCPWPAAAAPGKEVYGSDRSPEDLQNSWRAAQRRFLHGSEAGNQCRSRAGDGEEGVGHSQMEMIPESGEPVEHLVLQPAFKSKVSAGVASAGAGALPGKDGTTMLGLLKPEEQEVAAQAVSVKVPWGASLPSQLPPTSAAFFTTAVYGAPGDHLQGVAPGEAAVGVHEEQAADALLRTMSSLSALSELSGQRQLLKISESGRMSSMRLLDTESTQQGGPPLTTIELFFPDGPEADSAGGWLIHTDRSGVEADEPLPELESIAEATSTADEITARASHSGAPFEQQDSVVGSLVQQEATVQEQVAISEWQKVGEGSDQLDQVQQEEEVEVQLPSSEGSQQVQEVALLENASAPESISSAAKVKQQRPNLVPKPKQTQKQKAAAEAAAAAPQQAAKRRSPVFHVTMALVVVSAAVLISQLRYVTKPSTLDLATELIAIPCVGATIASKLLKYASLSSHVAYIQNS
jgi:hypothetical protein